MIENQMIFFFSAILLSGCVGGVVSWMFSQGKITRISLERDNLREMIEHAIADSAAAGAPPNAKTGNRLVSE